MGVRFRPMSEADYYDLGGFVRTAGNNDTFDQLSASLDSTALFGESDGYSNAIEQVLERLHRRAAIKLTYPTFNYVLARSGAKFLWRILGVSSQEGDGIINMTLALDLSTHKLVDVSELSIDDDYLLGAQIAEQYIKEFDFDAEILKAMEDLVLHELTDKTSREDLRNATSITKGSGDIKLCAGYYLTITNHDEFYSFFKRGHNEETLQKYIREGVFGSGDSRLTYLLNMNRDKSGLYGMINYYVAVVPPEMRPKVQNKEHKLTTRYAAIITANNELRTVVSSRANPMDVQSKYLMLENAVSKLQYKNQGTSSSVALDDLSLLERFKGKKGQLRMRNLGKRSDYSGRAVVVVNPYLPLDMIKLPACMLPSILEFHVLPYLAANINKNNASKENGEIYSTIYDKIKLTNLQDAEAQAEILSLIREHKILEKIPIPLGRQPTLHKLGIQAFYCEISDSQAIEVNPLVCPAFNMDFDGDTGYCQVPLRPESIAEIRDLVLTTHNIFLPKTGECTIEPRHEMLYGLYMATRSTYSKGNPVGGTFKDLSAVREAVIDHQVKVWDTVKVANGKTYIAGEAAFIACFPDGDVVARDEVPGKGSIRACEVTSKTITQFIDHVLRTNSDGERVHRIGTRYDSVNTFVGCINHLVELGFKVAYLYTRSLSMLKDMQPVPEYDSALKNYFDEMADYDFSYDMGFMTPEDYKIVFNKASTKLNKAYSKNIYDKLSDSSGYVLMAKSGCRGKASNLVQMFGIKGIVKKNNDEAFDAILTNSYHSQLTPMNGFVAAYGGRQGQMDKSLKTADTGYVSRQMWHADDGISIVCEDCGTKEGITITKNYLTKFIDPDSSTYYEELQDMFEHAIVGRYTTDGEYISDIKAKTYAKDASVEKITIRSPLKCKCTCCAKCYGVDWSTRRKVVVGTAVELIAAQSIGEPASQLTLKQFQTGGVAGASDITSSFDKLSAYIHCTDLGTASKAGRYSGYDPLAWADGPVIETPSSSINEKVIRIGDDTRRRIVMPNSVKVRSHAIKGEGLAYKHGDYSIPEILEISGIEAAQMYLMYKLYNLYKDECDICMVHFEILVLCMTQYMIINSDVPELKVGQYYSQDDMNKYASSKVDYVARLLSVRELKQVSQDALDTIIMENQGRGLSRVCALGLGDSLEKPLSRMALGLTIKTGSAVPGYVEERRRQL